MALTMIMGAKRFMHRNRKIVESGKWERMIGSEMFGKKVEAVTGFRSPDSAILPCAAVATDRTSSAGSGLEKSVHKGIPRERSDARPGDGVPWSVPENLDDWKGRFPLKDLNPAWFNLRDDLPPKHAGLDAVARFILDIK